MDVVYSQRESLAYNHDYINSDDENLVWNNSCEPDVKSEKTNPVSPISKEEIKKSIIQKCHKLAKLTGCSLFIKITDHEDDESQYYGTYDYVRDYQDNELRPDERDVAVSGESGVAITFADICTQQPWNMFMWTLNDSNKLSMISHQNDTDVPDNNDPEECNEKLSETDSQKTESANEEEMNVDNFQDDIVNDIDLDFDHQSKPEDLSQKKDDNESEEYKPAKLSTLPVNCVSPTTTASTLIMSTPTPAVLSRREHDNLLSCLPKLDSVGGLVGTNQGETLHASLLSYNMFLDQPTKAFKYPSFANPTLTISALLNAELSGNNLGPNLLEINNRSLGDPGDRRFQCEVCGKGFSLLGNLKTHRRIHSQEKPFKCETCGKGFTQSGNLRAHERIHTGEKPFSCHICAKSFVQIQHLKSHMRTHSGERPYQCKDCGKAFTQASTLRAHIRIHSGERPYQCKVCAKAFSQSSNLKEHVRIHTKHQKLPINQAALVALSNGVDIPGLSPLDEEDNLDDDSILDISLNDSHAATENLI